LHICFIFPNLPLSRKKCEGGKSTLDSCEGRDVVGAASAKPMKQLISKRMHVDTKYLRMIQGMKRSGRKEGNHGTLLTSISREML
jgi:hypothetical protein